MQDLMSKRQSMGKFYSAFGTYNTSRRFQSVLLHDTPISPDVIHDSQKQKAPHILDSVALGLISKGSWPYPNQLLVTPCSL